MSGDIGRAYGLGKLRHALKTATEHPDPETRALAIARAEAWNKVIAGLDTGTLAVGRRRPIEHLPLWVTLEVVTGGFATGRALAEGPLSAFEQAEGARLPEEVPGSTERDRLNRWFVSDDGRAQLLDAVRTHRVRLTNPEDGALLVVAWLVDAGDAAGAMAVLTEIEPYFTRLRFYPDLLDEPVPQGSTVHLMTAAQVARGLSTSTLTHPRLTRMYDTLEVFNPLIDEMVALLLDTVDDEGLPGQRLPDDFESRRRAVTERWKRAVKKHGGGRHARPRGNGTVLVGVLRDLGKRPIAPRRLHLVRDRLKGILTKRGAPGDPRHRALRDRQAADAAMPRHATLAGLLIRRLDTVPAGAGVPDLPSFTGPVTEAEQAADLPADAVIPDSLQAKVRRALEAPIAELVEDGIVRSSEVLAQVLPQITSQVAAAGLDDPVLQSIHAGVYSAFRKRRSLLLVNYAKQVQLDELPWVRVLRPWQTSHAETRTHARLTLREVTLLALSGFPYTLLPNPLVQEMQALVRQAHLDLPLVEELAADIFMGGFTAKWGRAAQITADELRGTLYADYYDLPDEWTPPKARNHDRTKLDAPFARLCRDRSREAHLGGSGSYVATGGAVIEQSQILTTQNLAPLMARLELRGVLTELAPALVERIWAFLIRHPIQTSGPFVPRLRRVKNLAYAWRQAIFFLSLVDRRRASALTRDLARRIDPQTHRAVFLAMRGLRAVLSGDRFDATGHAGRGRRFLGWVVGDHWAL